MPELVSRIQKTILPLKEKLLSMLSPIPAATTTLPSSAASDDGWLTDTSEGSEIGFDELDLQQLELILVDDEEESSSSSSRAVLSMEVEEEEVEPHHHQFPRQLTLSSTMMGKSRSISSCGSDTDDITDAASLLSDEEPCTPKRSLDSFLSLDSINKEVSTLSTSSSTTTVASMDVDEDITIQSAKRQRMEETTTTTTTPVAQGKAEVVVVEVVPAPAQPPSVAAVVPPPAQPTVVSPPPTTAPAPQQQQQHVTSSNNARTVEYQCSQCSETYPGNVSFNPWWALVQEECPKCHKLQVSE